jgi:hypothetical protein
MLGWINRLFGGKKTSEDAQSFGVFLTKDGEQCFSQARREEPEDSAVTDESLLLDSSPVRRRLTVNERARRAEAASARSNDDWMLQQSNQSAHVGFAAIQPSLLVESAASSPSEERCSPSSHVGHSYVSHSDGCSASGGFDGGGSSGSYE